MADPVSKELPLRHPAEIPMFIFMVVLNFAILGVLIDFLMSLALIPTELRGTDWQAAWRACAIAVLLIAPAILLVRQVQRASIPVRRCSCPGRSSRTCTPLWTTSPAPWG